MLTIRGALRAIADMGVESIASAEGMPVRISLFLVTIGAGVLLTTLLSAGSGAAQEPSNRPAVSVPAPAAIAPAHPATAELSAHDKQLLTDFGWLARFKEANEKLSKPTPEEKRVVFMGDSITEGWHFTGPNGSFPTTPSYVNRGISGQTSPQMLVRFRQDVVDLQPKVVVILAGTNDVAGNTGPMTIEQTEANIADMADIAKSNGIRVVLCSVLPAFDFPWHPGMEPAPKINAINAWIKSYAAEKGYVYVDYHTAMKDGRDGIPSLLSLDGVHPNLAGYAIMAPLVEAGIAKALAD